MVEIEVIAVSKLMFTMQIADLQYTIKPESQQNIFHI